MISYQQSRSSESCHFYRSESVLRCSSGRVDALEKYFHVLVTFFFPLVEICSRARYIFPSIFELAMSLVAVSDIVKIIHKGVYKKKERKNEIKGLLFGRFTPILLGGNSPPAFNNFPGAFPRPKCIRES